MTKVLIFGTFDVIHPGHQWFLRQAADHGDDLIAVIARDQFVKNWKGKSPVLSENERLAAIKASGLVQDAVLGDKEIRTYGVVERVQPDIICLGHDQQALRDDLEAWLEGRDGIKKPKIEILPPWNRHRYSSSLRNRPGGRKPELNRDS